MSEDGRSARYVEHARRYATLGWALIPLNGKEPRSRRWQTVKSEEPVLVAG